MPDLARSTSLAAPTSPQATRFVRPRWNDARLLVGVLLVMTSVVVGSRVVAGAERTEQVWAVAGDLAAGTQLTAADLQPRAVHLGAVAANYLRVAAVDPVGSVLARPVAAGDLLPSAALEAAAEVAVTPMRQVTVPVASFHYPADLARGRLVDVYVTPGAESASSAAAPVLLASSALVVAVEDSSSRLTGVAASIGVVLSVPDDAVSALVAGLHQGPVDLVRVSGP